MSTSSSTPTHTTGQRDLTQRTARFAREARAFVRRTPKTIASMGDCRRLIRSSGEIGSSYLRAENAESRQEFAQCILQCCREASQAGHWLHLLDANLDEKSKELHAELQREAGELEKIFGAIFKKVRPAKKQ